MQHLYVVFNSTILYHSFSGFLRCVSGNSEVKTLCNLRGRLFLFHSHVYGYNLVFILFSYCSVIADPFPQSHVYSACHNDRTRNHYVTARSMLVSTRTLSYRKICCSKRRDLKLTKLLIRLLSYFDCCCCACKLAVMSLPSLLANPILYLCLCLAYCWGIHSLAYALILSKPLTLQCSSMSSNFTSFHTGWLPLLSFHAYSAIHDYIFSPLTTAFRCHKCKESSTRPTGWYYPLH